MTDETIETDIEKLTHSMLDLCVPGTSTGVMIGAAFNVAQTAIGQITEKPLLAIIVQSFRFQADRLEAQIKGVTH